MAMERADLQFPRANQDPMTSGLLGAGMVGFTIMVFAGLAGLDIDQFLIAAVVTIAAGFLFPYLRIRHHQNLRWQAYLRELEVLEGPKRRQNT